MEANEETKLLESLYTYQVDDNLPGTEILKSEHESHCDRCFNVRKCQKLNILASNTRGQIIECPIVVCRFFCGQEFHECKRDEHNLICSNVKVSCINVENGCPMVMERRFLAKHLGTCPASVIVCTMEWNRWPMPYGENPLVIELGKNQLDLEFLRRDERTAAEWREQLPQRLRNCLKTALNSKYPVMPLGVSGNRIPHCITSENIVDKVSGCHPDNLTESEHDDSSDSPWGAKRSPPGLQESVCNKLALPGHSKERSHKETVNNEGDKLVAKPVDSNPRLSPIVEIVPRSKIKPRNIFTFMCAREFRRDEYSGHFQYVHSAVLTQLNGWLFNRCPMAAQGCTFGVERMFPFNDSHRIIYNKDMDAFCPTKITCDITQTEHQKSESGEEKPTSICDFPFEVLVNLTRYLDPLSLSSLSMTCCLMREVCAYVVVNRGIVVLQWEKRPRNLGWEVISKKWLFSTSFSPIRKWSFADVGRMSNHMKNCPRYERQLADKPFTYHVTDDDLL